MQDMGLILSADLWGMTDEKTGEHRAGASVWYVNDYRDDSAQALGFKPTKVSCSTAAFEAIQRSGITLPAIGRLRFVTRPGAQNKATIVLDSIELERSVDLFAPPASKASK